MRSFRISLREMKGKSSGKNGHLERCSGVFGEVFRVMLSGEEGSEENAADIQKLMAGNEAYFRLVKEEIPTLEQAKESYTVLPPRYRSGSEDLCRLL